MAANSIKSVPFNEGAPLDPNALNQLREDILTTYTTSNLLYNNTVGDQSNPKVLTGNVGTAKLVLTNGANTAGVPILIGTTLVNPIVVVSIASPVPSGEQVTLWVTGNGQDYTVYGQSSNTKSNRTYTINWAAFQLKDIGRV
jgi:hypothetical protein